MEQAKADRFTQGVRACSDGIWGGAEILVRNKRGEETSLKPRALRRIIIEWADDTQPEPVEDDLSAAVKKSWDRFEAAMEASEIEQQTIDDLQDALKKSRAEAARWKEKAERSARRHLKSSKNRA